MAKHKSAQTLQDWLYYREFGQASYGPPPLTPGDRLVWRLRNMQKQLFERQVATPQLIDRLDTPPESVRSILEKRTASAKTTKVQAPRPNFRRAARNGVLAGLIFMLVSGTVLVITKIH